MISASHNVFTDNGLKLLNSKGEKMDDAMLEEVEKYLDGDCDSIPFATGADIGRTIDYAAGRNRYIGRLITSRNTLTEVLKWVLTARTAAPDDSEKRI